MEVDLARRVSNYYLAIGIAGLVGELMLVEYVLTSGVWKEDTGDLLLAEAALVALVYGIIFGLAILVRTRRVAPEINNLRGARPQRILLVLLVGLMGLGGLNVYLFAIGLWGPLDTAINVLHFFPIFGMLGAPALIPGIDRSGPRPEPRLEGGGHGPASRL